MPKIIKPSVTNNQTMCVFTSKATNGNIHFDYIKNENYADIQVIFQEKFNQDQIEWYSFTAGRTQLIVDENNKFKIKKTQIIIVNRNNITGKYYEKESLYTIILHEIGHSLGLWKHSNNKQSIMYKEFVEEQKITQKDIERLKKIYKF